MANPSLVKLQLTSFPQSSVRRVTVKYTPSHLVGDVVGESEDDGNDDGEVVVVGESEDDGNDDGEGVALH